MGKKWSVAPVEQGFFSWPNGGRRNFIDADFKNIWDSPPKKMIASKRQQSVMPEEWRILIYFHTNFPFLPHIE